MMSKQPPLISLACWASWITANVSAPTATASLPAAWFTRDTSLSGSQVVITFSMRTISAVAASKAAWTAAVSRSGVVKEANDTWVPIACPSAVTFSGVNAGGGVALEPEPAGALEGPSTAAGGPGPGGGALAGAGD